jgi:hypothetical protein
MIHYPLEVQSNNYSRSVQGTFMLSERYTHTQSKVRSHSVQGKLTHISRYAQAQFKVLSRSRLGKLSNWGLHIVPILNVLWGIEFTLCAMTSPTSRSNRGNTFTSIFFLKNTVAHSSVTSESSHIFPIPLLVITNSMVVLLNTDRLCQQLCYQSIYSKVPALWQTSKRKLNNKALY